jgi:hypothetical protein
MRCLPARPQPLLMNTLSWEWTRPSPTRMSLPGLLLGPGRTILFLRLSRAPLRHACPRRRQRCSQPCHSNTCTRTLVAHLLPTTSTANLSLPSLTRHRTVISLRPDAQTSSTGFIITRTQARQSRTLEIKLSLTSDCRTRCPAARSMRRAPLALHQGRPGCISSDQLLLRQQHVLYSTMLILSPVRDSQASVRLVSPPLECRQTRRRRRTSVAPQQALLVPSFLLLPPYRARTTLNMYLWLPLSLLLRRWSCLLPVMTALLLLLQASPLLFSMP